MLFHQIDTPGKCTNGNEIISDLSWVEKRIKPGKVKFEMNVWPS